MNPTRTSRRPPAHPQPARWLGVAVAGVLLTVGIRHFRPPAPPPAGPPAAIPATSAIPVTPSDRVLAAANLHHRPAADPLAPVNPLADHLAQLLQALATESDPLKREQFITDYLARLNPGDLPGVLAALNHAPPVEFARDLSRRVVRLWAGQNPAAVAAWLSQQPAGDQRQLAAENLALVWAGGDLASATDWGLSLTDPDESSSVLTAIAGEAVRSYPAGALQLAVDLPPTASRDDLIRRAATEWATGDATNAVAWAEQIPDPDLRANVLAGEAVAWAGQDPVSAATLALQQLPPGRQQADTIVSIIERWAQQQPQAAADWVAQFPEGPVRTAAMDNLVTQWSRQDAPAAQQWLARHT